MRTTPPRWPTRIDLLALGGVLALGLVNLAQPLHFDQAVFMLGAKRMAAGGALYRDFWDVKQPGIYLFYQLAGSLFRFDEVGVHLLELIVLVGAAAFQQRVLRRVYEDPRTAALSPLLTWGLYYLCGSAMHFTQVESLVGVPLFLLLEWSVTGGERDRPLAWFGAGIAGGAALVLKLAFAPLVMLLWAVGAAAILAPGRVHRGAALVRSALGFTAGLTVPVALTVAYLAAHGVLREAGYLFFVFPVKVLSGIHSLRLNALANGAGWFFGRWSGVLAFAALGAVLALARGLDRRVLGCVVWWIGGMGVILMQRWSLWPYHYMLLVVPTGVLAAYGLERVARILARHEPAPPAPLRRAALAAAVLFALAPPLGTAVLRATALVRSRFALSANDRLRFQQRVDDGTDVVDLGADVAFLAAPGARPGTLFVLGNPEIIWLARRDFPGTRLPGLLPGEATVADWDAWAAAITRERTPWVFIQREYRGPLERDPGRHSRFATTFARDYAFSHHGRWGDWYERRPEADAVPGD